MKSLWSSQREPHLKTYLIVGLGNPGDDYEETRHNAGFKVAKEFAKIHGLKFRQESRVYGELAEGKIGDSKVLVLLPMTYMNNSGKAVQACINYFKLGLENVVVVVDDVAFDVGDLRLKKEGSSGGHNGLKSIEGTLKTSSYPRLRIGIGSPRRQVLADYVLDKFSAGEKKDLTEVLSQAVDVLDLWIGKGIQEAMTLGNKKN